MPKTVLEIASKLNKTKEKIRQIETRALRKLRHPDRSVYLRSYII
ncbi:MAG: sigma factor-like helix-turn-helix DNA-binding protein [Prochloraceae cyanobacterium]